MAKEIGFTIVNLAIVVLFILSLGLAGKAIRVSARRLLRRRHPPEG